MRQLPELHPAEPRFVGQEDGGVLPLEQEPLLQLQGLLTPLLGQADAAARSQLRGQGPLGLLPKLGPLGPLHSQGTVRQTWQQQRCWPTALDALPATAIQRIGSNCIRSLFGSSFPVTSGSRLGIAI